LLVQEFSFADAIGGSGGRLKNEPGGVQALIGTRNPTALPRCKIEIPLPLYFATSGKT
jgi:hypothetical protein